MAHPFRSHTPTLDTPAVRHRRPGAADHRARCRVPAETAPRTDHEAGPRRGSRPG